MDQMALEGNTQTTRLAIFCGALIFLSRKFKIDTFLLVMECINAR